MSAKKYGMYSLAIYGNEETMFSYTVFVKQADETELIIKHSDYLYYTEKYAKKDGLLFILERAKKDLQEVMEALDKTL